MTALGNSRTPGSTNKSPAGFFRPHAIGSRLRGLCVKAGVKHCIAYGYRHSFATDALAKGVPDAQVAALLGHSGTAMLHYTTPISERGRKRCGMARCTPAYADPSITVAFSPNAGATDTVVAVISEAQHSIHLAGYGFTSRPIAEALIVAHCRGVEVKVVLDQSNAKAMYTEAKLLQWREIPVRIDSRYAIMHDKFIVVDGVTVETGSFNFTSAAERLNAENVIVLREYPAVAAAYEENWQGLWKESEPLK